MSGTVESGLLAFEVEDEFGRPPAPALHLLLSENVPRFGRQYRVKARSGAGEVGGCFPAGCYTAQILAEHYGVMREAVRLEPGTSVRIRLRLDPHCFVEPTLEQRLALYGLPLDRLRPLTVRAGERVRLDCRSNSDPRHFVLLQPNSVRELKRWIGAPDAAFAGDTPRFGPVPDPSQLSAIAREFIHGNSRAVRAFEALLDARLCGLDDPFQDLVPVPVFLFADVVVEDGGLLEIGIGSRVFFCDTLTMYPQGVVRVGGEVRADIGTYIQL
ncbi:MAG TPA: hypothetical protein VM689_06515 [Aliidongia sp.]|nr:hypothetical protein [Aliidongia sp.]